MESAHTSQKDVASPESESTKSGDTTSHTGCCERVSQFLVKCSLGLEHFLQRVFERHGRFLAMYPWQVIFASVLACGLCSVGFLYWTTESRIFKLWTPQSSLAVNHYNWVLDVFGYGVRTGELLVRSDRKHGALSTQVVLDFHTAHSLLRNSSANVRGEYKDRFPQEYVFDASNDPWNGESTEFENTGRNLTSVCEYGGFFCQEITILDVLGRDYQSLSLLTDDEILTMVNDDSLWFDRNGREISKSKILGGISYDSDGLIESASVLRGEYTVSNAAFEKDNSVLDPSRQAWELEVARNVIIRDRKNEQRKRKVFKSSRVTCYFRAGYDDEFDRALSGDLDIATFAYILLISYSAIAMGKRDMVHSMVSLSFASIICVGLALFASHGLASLFGIFYAPLHQSLPFLILGLGVDDGFIISGEFQRQSMLRDYRKIRCEKADKYECEKDSKQGEKCAKSEDDEGYDEDVELMAATMKHAGVSVLITSVTDFAAFSIGSTTVLPALETFCLYAAIGVFVVFSLNITLFSAAVVINAQRAKRHRLDLFCCWKARCEDDEGRPIHTMFLCSDFVEFHNGFALQIDGDGDGSAPMVEMIAVSSQTQKKEVTDDAGESETNQKKDASQMTESDFRSVAEFERQPFLGCLHRLPERMSHNFFRRMGLVITSDWRVKSVILLMVLTLTSICVWGSLNLVQDFDIEWFLPRSSYISRFWRWNRLFFKEGSDKTYVQIYTVNSNDFDYFNHGPLLDSVVSDVIEKADYLFNSDNLYADWHGAFQDMSLALGIDLKSEELRYFDNLYDFLYSTPDTAYENQTLGSQFRSFIRFQNQSEPALGLNGAFQLALYRNTHLETAEEKVRSMRGIRQDTRAVIQSYNEENSETVQTSEMFAFNTSFVFWYQFTIIFAEFWQNIWISGLVITVITLLLIPDLRTAMLVLLSVSLSIVDVLGLMYFNDLTIDAISMSYTVIAIGLTVDYSAHIGEAFLQSNQSTRDDCVVDALYSVGASVFSGAFSTFLAVLVLAGASTYILRVFFLQFFFVTLLGSLHGLVVLPVFLSLFGPQRSGDVHSSIEDEKPESNGEPSPSEDTHKETEVYYE